MIKSVFVKNNARQNAYRNFCKEVGKPYLGPSLDTPTRWNSTWQMMYSALRQKETLQVFHDILVNNRKACRKFSDEKWLAIQRITKLLESFKDATTVVSGIYYSTSPLVLNQIFVMAKEIGTLEYENKTFQTIGEKMKEKLLKYFLELPPTFTCAAALNPTINVGGVEGLINDIAFVFGIPSLNPNYIENAQNSFNRSLQNMYEVYLSKYGTTNVIHDQYASASSFSGRSSSNPQMSLFNSLQASQSKRSRTTTVTSELGNYRSTNFIGNMDFEHFNSFNILAWWKERETQFPVLSAMARDLLTVQASTVASESAFSISGRVISDRRSRLTAESIECCICLKDFLDGTLRQQHMTTLEEPFYCDVEEFIHTEEVEEGLSPPIDVEDDEDVEE
ncbi:hypothetical protein OSB04_015073 [Centaurea solstitialis]|uniref:HAT C-terminal dimerisation domain-containing protein n=1 Tax=Centaurea solstitialis TaxID=347529 RepID=A0AA38T644_9ASTR|nr:hypothetical protein OSB04_015073 [Centaurea solstitialis]